MAFNDTAAALFNSARIIRKSKKNRSIARLSKDSIMLYPNIMSAGIPVPEAMTITKELEKQDAAMLLSIFSLNNAVDMNYYCSITDYLKQYHNNNDIPEVISTMDNLITTNTKLLKGAKESFVDLGPDEYAIETITAFIIDNCNEDGTVICKPQVSTECWDILEDQLNLQSINDVYKPFSRTEKAMEAIIDQYNDRLNRQGPQANRGINSTTRRTQERRTDGETATTVTTEDPSTGRRIQERRTDGGTTTTVTTEEPSVVRNIDKSAPKVLNDRSLSNMEPTLVQCEFLMHGGKGIGAGAGTMIHTAIFGVKGMTRLVSSDIMIAEITKALVSSNPIFKFIKWAKGENKLVRDLMLGLDDVKEDAMKAKSGAKVFSTLRSLRRRNKIGRVTGNNVPATTTIIITDYEAEAIKQATGLDLYADEVGQKIIYDHFLLGFGIYNTESKVLSIMFDSYNSYMETTLGAMQSAAGKDVNLSNIKDVLKLIGRVS